MASNNLALTYRLLGRLEEAELLQEGVIRLGTEISGQRHPNTLLFKLTMAEIYQSYGRKAAALSLLDSVDTVILETLGNSSWLYKESQNIRVLVEQLPDPSDPIVTRETEEALNDTISPPDIADSQQDPRNRRGVRLRNWLRRFFS